jgi:hypothetical protein
MLCSACATKFFIKNIGKCEKCGTMTSSGQFTLCDKHSKELNECAACREKLADKPKEGSTKAPAAS